jgi:acetylornithine deacetylase/succinyl-diaminopimelate desuccinylase-like protein
MQDDLTARLPPPAGNDKRAALRAMIDASMPLLISDLVRLVRIPSVSEMGSMPDVLRASATATADLLSDAGMPSVRLLEIDGAAPYVFAESPAPSGHPTALLYAHHDVKPAGDGELWDDPPFEGTVRNGRLYGRGAADDKAGIVAHAAAVRAHQGNLPIGLKVIVEGEEEIGSPHLDEFIAAYGNLLSAEAIVLADNENWSAGIPALTTSLRGLVECTIEVRVLDGPTHSGSFGGPLTDAMSTLAVALGALYDRDGNVAVPGLVSNPAPPVEVVEEDFRAEAGARPSVRLLGSGTIAERLWMKPAVSVLGIDCPSVAESYTKLEPAARAKVSLRIPPGQDPNVAMEALGRHLRASVPWGAEVVVEPIGIAKPVSVASQGPIFDAAIRSLHEAFGHPPVQIGGGGTIPTAAALSEAFPDATLLLTGVAGPDSRAHAENEALDLVDFAKSCLAEAILIAEFGELE